MYIPEPKETPSGWRIQLRINGQSIPVLADTPKECKRQAALIKAQAQAAGKPVKKCDLTLSQALMPISPHFPPIFLPPRSAPIATFSGNASPISCPCVSLPSPPHHCNAR